MPLNDVKVWDVNEVYSSTQIFSPSPTAGLRDEVNLLAVSSINADDFPEGWVSYPFYSTFNTRFRYVVAKKQGGSDIYYEGAPVRVLWFSSGHLIVIQLMARGLMAR